jgi:hypothetical protein
MPVVPEARNLVDFPSGSIGPRRSAEHGRRRGDGRAVRFRAWANQLSDAAEVQNQIDTIHDHAAVKEQINKNLNLVHPGGLHRPDAYFQKDGRDAVEGSPIIAKGLDDAD